MRKQTKIAALVSAAALLAIGASMTSFAKTGWVETPEGSDIWQYLDKYEQPVYGEWHRSGTGWFYIGYDGYMVKNQAVIGDNGDLYYVDDSGARVYDCWIEINATNGEAVQEGWYYFNATNGKAVRADSTKGEYQLIKVRKSLTDATKVGFVFDTNGRMQEGWARRTYTSTNKPADTYYCVQPGDDMEIQVEGDFDYVEGQVLTGWAKMFVPEDYCDTNSQIDDFGYGWYYFDGGAMLTYANTGALGKKLSWLGWSAYYTFDDWGILKGSLSVPVATTPTATNSNTAAVYFDGNDSYNNGNSWTYDFGSDVWYYIVNLKSNGSTVARGVKFNSDGEKVTCYDGVERGVIRVKSIGGQLYAFDNSGKMLSGDVYIYGEMIDAWGGRDSRNGNYYWNAIPFKGVEEPGWYYFNAPADPKASTAGRMMRNMRVTTYDADDGDPHTRYYAADGKAAESESYNNYLYDRNGDLYLPEDGDNFRIISADEAWNDVYVKFKDGKQVDAVDLQTYDNARQAWYDANRTATGEPEDDENFKYYGYERKHGFLIHTGSRTSGAYAVYGDENGEQELLINRSGALIRDGVINIDSETQVTVKNYVITDVKYR